MPNKNYNACSSCKYDALNDACRYTRCRDCALYTGKPVEGTEGHLVYCKCLTVKCDEECPYYEEATDAY